MEYSLGPIPWVLQLANPDGMPIKTNKAVLMHKLEEKSALYTSAKEPHHIHVIDSNALYHGLADLPMTLGELAKKIFNSLPKVAKVDFLTDNYKDDSIKSFERAPRGQSQA
ncbi:hypothetical protein ElyMa_006661200 [Elysia marginata]|uniref:Uncharacterized protein n=1 Tax=Elysia marginata TaxID=1093978 RepID=A0AAV4IKZ8_9GAST|nr:hypothetical protein ElyMa_006661200 [Elysia marginata]